MTDLENHPLVLKARAFAIAAHSAVGQVRGFSGDKEPLPYYTHPIAVAHRVAQVPGATPEMVAAALLHDVVEDTKVTIELIYQEFGAEVGRMVAGLTDVSRPEDGKRDVRKALDRAHTAEQEPDVKTIKLADIDHNIGSIVENGGGFAFKWMHEKRLLMPALIEGDPTLYARVNGRIESFFAEAA